MRTRGRRHGYPGGKEVNDQIGLATLPAFRLAGEGLLRQQKSPDYRGFLEADDGIRTHDLLHGKQTL